MKNLIAALIALFVSVGSTASAQAPPPSAGDAQAGKALWESPATMCRNCHGGKGEGGFGPDLAGRHLSLAQFTRAVRAPWGIMPAYTPRDVTDVQLANFLAYFRSLPEVATPPAPRPVPAAGPWGQQMAIAHGCASCHGAQLGFPRQKLGGIGADFPLFTRIVYEHSSVWPGIAAELGEKLPIRMGNFSPLRVPEATLRDIWDFAVSLGFRVPMEARLEAESSEPGGHYRVALHNAGIKGKGLAAEDVTVSLTLAEGVTVAEGGTGYQGSDRDPQSAATIARWKVPQLTSGDHHDLAFTLSGGASGAPVQRGTVNWTRPTLGNGARDQVNVVLPRPAER